MIHQFRSDIFLQFSLEIRQLAVGCGNKTGKKSKEDRKGNEIPSRPFFS